jgi:hypothetical protein
MSAEAASITGETVQAASQNGDQARDRAETETFASSDSTTPVEVEVEAEENTYQLLPDGHKKYAKGKDPMLRYLKPYWYPYRTFVKNRWIGRELLEVVSTEFRDRSVEYYVSGTVLQSRSFVCCGLMGTRERRGWS